MNQIKAKSGKNHKNWRAAWSCDFRTSLNAYYFNVWMAGRFITTGIVGVVWVALWLWLAKENSDSKVESLAVNGGSNVTAIESESKFTSILFSKNFLFAALYGFATY